MSFASSAYSTGLTKWPSKPASSDRARSSGWPQPVTAASTMRLPHRSDRTRRATSYPLTSGMPISISMISGRKSAAASMAACPSYSALTRWPEHSSSFDSAFAEDSARRHRGRTDALVLRRRHSRDRNRHAPVRRLPGACPRLGRHLERLVLFPRESRRGTIYISPVQCTE